MTRCHSSCVEQPLSWFLLEQYKLGELDHQTAATTREHLGRCPACAEVLAYLDHDQVELPVLPAVVPVATVRRLPVRRWQAGVGLLAAAAAALLLVLVPGQEPQVPSNRTVTKGGELVLALIGQRGDDIREDPTSFREGDRFRLLLTAPAAGPVRAEVVVFQNGAVFFPYPEDLYVETGNQKGIAGAFYLTEQHPAVVCVMMGAALPNRDELRSQGLSVLPQATVCRVLSPE